MMCFFCCVHLGMTCVWT